MEMVDLMLRGGNLLWLEGVERCRDRRDDERSRKIEYVKTLLLIVRDMTKQRAGRSTYLIPRRMTLERCVRRGATTR